MSFFVAMIACGAVPMDLGAGAGAAPEVASLQRWPDGTPRVEGSEVGGVPVGTWTWWAEDGSFRSQTTFVDGVQEGARREVGTDGRVVELELRHGVVTTFRTLPADTPMPEWEGGRRVDGTRYARSISSRP